LHGGLHYETHGIKPCIHHTFAHAKPLVTLLHEHERTALISKSKTLPIVEANGIQHFPEIDVWLAAKGDFRATISTYDFIYKAKAQQGSGGSICLLYHMKLGPIFTASMANYLLIEKNNQQPNPGKEEVVLLPVISPTGELVSQKSPNKIEINKPEGILIVEANVPLQIKKMEKERAFNMVPGVEVLPIIASFNNDKLKEIICTLRVVDIN